MLRSKGRLLSLLSLCSLLLFVPLLDTQAQDWRQNARIIVPVKNVPPWEGPRGSLNAFLDSLIYVAEKSNGKHLLKRAPSQKEEMSISDLKKNLVNEEGVGLRSASHAIIDYRFEFDGGNDFEESIKRIRYIFRPGAGEEDVSLLYVDTQKDWVQKILYETGTPTSENLDADILFRTQLHFAKVSEESGAQLIEIGNRTVREGFEEKKKEFVEKVYKLTYDFLAE